MFKKGLFWVVFASIIAVTIFSLARYGKVTEIRWLHLVVYFFLILIYWSGGKKLAQDWKEIVGEDERDIILMLVIFIITLLLHNLLLVLGKISRELILIKNVWTVAVFALLSLACQCWAFWVRLAFLQNNWTGNASTEPSRVEKGGPYRYIRHPIYAGTVAMFLFASLAFCTFVSLMVSLLIWIYYYKLATIEEQNLLKSKWGEEYKKYIDTTGRFFPRWWKKSKI